jgi:hypothetical protein
MWLPVLLLFVLIQKVTARRTVKKSRRKNASTRKPTHTPLFRRAYARIVLDVTLKLTRPSPARIFFLIISN